MLVNQTMPSWAVDFDEVKWAPNRAPGDAFGECSHTCEHKKMAVVASGPDGMRDKLMACVDQGCSYNPSVQCRAWYTAERAVWGAWMATWVGVPR